MSQFFELHYHLPEDPARLFDVAQGLAGRRNILKRGGTVKVKPFTETCRRLLFQWHRLCGADGADRCAGLGLATPS